MPVPNTFANATATIPLSQLDANFATTITLGNTAIQLGNTVSTLNNMTLANVTISSGNVTITNVTVTTANVTTANITTAVITTANVATANVTTSQILNYGTANGVAYLNTSKALTTGTGLVFDGSNLGVATSAINTTVWGSTYPKLAIGTTTNAGVLQFESTAAAANNKYLGGVSALNLGSGVTANESADILFYQDGTSATNPGGRISFFTRTDAGSVTEKMRLDTSGNLGLGVTPSAWSASFRALQVSNFGLMVNPTNGNTYQLANAYFDTGYKYLTSAAALRFEMVGGAYAWSIAPSGTAGNAITFTQAMTLDASGNLGIGTTSPSTFGQLAVYGNGTAPVIANFLGSNSPATNATYGDIAFGSRTDGTVTARIRGLANDNGNGTDGQLSFWTADNTAGAGALTERMRLDASGKLLVGVTSGQGKVVIANADGANAPTTVTAANSYLHIGSGDFGPAGNGKFMVAFGYTGTSYTNAPAYIGFEETTGVGGTKGYLSFYTRDVTTDTAPTERARITSAGGFTCAGIYNTTVGATNRDVFVDNGGVVGYVSSLRASKTNIQDLTDTSWLHQLNPVTFNYRKKDEEGSYTDETDGDIQYGLIAEDVEQVRPDLCFYDEVDGEQELRGIQYSKLVPVMLKEIQKLKAEIEALKGNA